MAGPALRILGIDPGLRITGFGIIEKNGASIAYIASGCIKSGNSGPQQIAIEKVFVNVNPASTLALGQARGTAICAAVDAGLPVSEYTALQVKQAVVGNGHASKEQVQHMVKRLLSLAGAPSADAADALACAICHAHGGRLGKLSTRGFRVKRGRLV